MAQPTEVETPVKPAENRSVPQETHSASEPPARAFRQFPGEPASREKSSRSSLCWYCSSAVFSPTNISRPTNRPTTPRWMDT